MACFNPGFIYPGWLVWVVLSKWSPNSTVQCFIYPVLHIYVYIYIYIYIHIYIYRYYIYIDKIYIYTRIWLCNKLPESKASPSRLPKILTDAGDGIGVAHLFQLLHRVGPVELQPGHSPDLLGDLGENLGELMMKCRRKKRMIVPIWSSFVGVGIWEVATKHPARSDENDFSAAGTGRIPTSPTYLAHTCPAAIKISLKISSRGADCWWRWNSEVEIAPAPGAVPCSSLQRRSRSNCCRCWRGWRQTSDPRQGWRGNPGGNQGAPAQVSQNNLALLVFPWR